MMSLLLSLGIVATDISQDDNGGAVCVSGVVGGKKQAARAVGSWERRTGVVASVKVSTSRRVVALYTIPSFVLRILRKISVP